VKRARSNSDTDFLYVAVCGLYASYLHILHYPVQCYFCSDLQRACLSAPRTTRRRRPRTNARYIRGEAVL